MTQAYEEHLAMGQAGPETVAAAPWDAATRVWVSDAAEGFVLGTVVAREGAAVTVRLDDAREVRAELDRQGGHAGGGVLGAERTNPPYLDGVEDMSQLSELNESSVLHNLRFRYSATRIHTYSGLFLVVVNPYAALPIYTPAITRMYEGRRRDEVAPHVFAVADEAYRSMIASKKNQQDKLVGQLEEQMVKANPILEAFGNAKTMRNDNSSRFGKFMQIQFTANGLVAGMKTVHYLLERSRICGRLKGERSFHIFYQLLAGASPELRAELKLGAPGDYEYLRSGECYAIDGVDDAKAFEETKAAMSLFGISPEAQSEVFRVVSAVLWLGNVRFHDNQQEEAQVSTPEALEAAAQLLGLGRELLERGLLKKRINAGGQAVITSQKAAMAGASRDALARALYDKLFDWLVRTINQTISHDGRTASFIGVLDIAGFEIFETNSFEQLCINFTNEKLQQFFNHHMFVREQDEYAREKITWSHQDFGHLLKDTIDMIERPGSGIFAVLEEQLYNTFGRGSPSFQQPKTSSSEFVLKHYAGWVTYTVDDWLTRNKNPLHEDLVEATRQARVRLVQELFAADTNAAAAVAAAAAARRGKSSNMDTVSSQFRGQLATLMGTLDQTEPHFVRCIKPNHGKQSWVVDAALVLDQLRCNGVLEGIRMSRLGYPLRVPFLDFVRRFRMLAPQQHERGGLPQSPSAAADYILSCTPLRRPEDYQIGVTKVFFRANKNATLERLRNDKVAKSAAAIQRAWRRHVFVRGYAAWREQHGAAKVIQKNAALWLASRRKAWDRVFLSLKPMLKTGKLDEEMQALREETRGARDAAARAQRAADELREADRAKERRIDELDAELQEQSTRSNQLSLELKERRAALALLQSTSAQREGQLAQQVDELKAALAAETAAKAVLGRNYVAATGLLQDAQAELASSREAAGSLERAKAALAAQLAESQERLARAEAAGSAASTARAALAQELAATKERLAEESAALGEAREAEEALQRDLVTARRELERTGQALAKAERTSKQNDAKMADMEASLARDQRQSAESRSAASRQVDEVRKQLDEQVAAQAALRSELEGSLEELAMARQKLARERADRERLDRGLQEARQQLDEATIALGSERATRAALEAAAAEQQTSAAAVSEELARERSARQRLEKLKKQRDGDLAAAVAERDAAAARASEGAERVAELERAIDELGLRIESDARAKEELQNTRDALEAQIADLRWQLEELAGKEQSLRSLVREKQVLRDRVAEETALREAAEESARSLGAELAAARERAKSTVDAHKYALLERKSREREAALAKELDDARQRIERDERAAEKLGEELDARTRELDDRTRACARLEADGRALRESTSQAQQEARALQAQVGALQSQARKAQQEAAALRAQAQDEGERAAQRLGEQKREYEAAVEELQQQVAYAQERLAKAQAAAKQAAESAKQTEELRKAEQDMLALKEGFEAQLRDYARPCPSLPASPRENAEKEWARKMAKTEESVKQLAAQVEKERARRLAETAELEEKIHAHARTAEERNQEIAKLRELVKAEKLRRRETEDSRRTQDDSLLKERGLREKDRQELAAANERVEKALAEMATLRAKNIRLEEQYEEAQLRALKALTPTKQPASEHKATVVSRENKALRDENRELRGRAKALQDKAAELQEENAALAKKFQEHEKEISSLKYQMARKSTPPAPVDKRPVNTPYPTGPRRDSYWIEQLEKEKQEMKAATEHLRSDLCKARGSVHQLEEQLEREVRKRDAKIAEWMKQADALGRQNVALQERVEELRVAVDVGRRSSLSSRERAAQRRALDEWALDAAAEDVQLEIEEPLVQQDDDAAAQ
eukprot:m51a1_g13159 putative myosin ii heavy chain (1836) ;mRNA; f:40709-47438